MKKQWDNNIRLIDRVSRIKKEVPSLSRKKLDQSTAHYNEIGQVPIKSDNCKGG